MTMTHGSENLARPGRGAVFVAWPGALVAAGDP